MRISTFTQNQGHKRTKTVLPLSMEKGCKMVSDGKLGGGVRKERHEEDG